MMDADLLTQIMVVVCVASFVGLCLLVMGGGVMQAKRIVFFRANGPFRTFENVKILWADGAVFVHQNGQCVFASNLPYAMEF